MEPGAPHGGGGSDGGGTAGDGAEGGARPGDRRLAGGSFADVTPTLLTRDVPATVAFYTGLLGFTVDTLWPEENPTLCVLDRGGVHLMFDAGADWDARGGQPALTGQLVLDVEDAAALHRALDGRVEVLWGPEVYAYGRREFSIRDPNGYRLVFSERTDDPPTD